MSTTKDIREAFYPIFYFTKICGYYPETFWVSAYISRKHFHSSSIITFLYPLLQPSEERYSKSSICYYIILFAFDLTLLALTIDPKIYKTLTNSSILNTGLWIQIVYSMVVTIFLMLMMASKRQQKWDFLLRMQQIDQTLQDKFHITLYYEMYSRCV